MTPDKYEVWLCIENHFCATHPTDKYFCWVTPVDQSLTPVRDAHFPLNTLPIPCTPSSLSMIVAHEKLVEPFLPPSLHRS